MRSDCLRVLTGQPSVLIQLGTCAVMVQKVMLDGGVHKPFSTASNIRWQLIRVA